MCGLLTAPGRFSLTRQQSRVGGVSEGSGERREGGWREGGKEVVAQQICRLLGRERDRERKLREE